MSIQTQVRDIQGTAISIQYSAIPDQCPICHSNISPRFITGVLAGANPGGLIQLIFQCPKRGCERSFIGLYKQNTSALYMLQKTTPLEAKPHTFPDSVIKISKMFVDIYNQAMAAESYNLTELTGIGLRKALEYLVKDYVISQSSDKAEDIKKSFLGQCIENYISDPNIKRCAKFAAWLGNDEAHYVRKWEDKDITDLKRLIKLTVNWIDNVLTTEQYMAEMDKKQSA